MVAKTAGIIVNGADNVSVARPPFELAVRGRVVIGRVEEMQA